MILDAIFQYVYDKRFIYQLLVSLATLIVIRLVCFMHTRHRRFQLFKHHRIPGPEPSLAGSGNFTAYRKAECKYQLVAEWSKKYGKVFGYFIGDHPAIAINDLDIAYKLFFEESETSLIERGDMFIKTPLTEGILFAHHNRWKVMRKLFSPYFSQYKVHGDSATQFIERSVTLMLDYIEQKLGKPTGAANRKMNFDIQNLMKATALHLISHMAIKLPGVHISENEAYVKRLHEFSDGYDKGIFNLAVVFSPLRVVLEFLARHFEYEKLLSLIHKGLNRMIDEKKREKNARVRQGDGTLIDTLINLYHEGKLTRSEVIANADGILIAGYDTTSTTLTYVFWALAKHQKIQERLRSELTAHGMESKYLEQVINETMRLYPTLTLFTTRLVTKTIVVDGWVMPQGSRVFYNTWFIHRSPSIWPDPEKFDPSRFRDGVNIHPCAFAPFGLGDKKCLGFHLAMLEMKMIICKILLRYRLKLIAPSTLELRSYSIVMTKPKEKVVIELERL